jgi:oligopeptide transport system substrate-binding protein
MARSRWPVLVLGFLLLCVCIGLCLSCVASVWLWSGQGGSSGIGLPIVGDGGTAGNSGGTLRLLGDEPRTLDPALVQFTTDAEYVVEIFSGLVTLNQDLQVVPDLAERWELSGDGKEYTFYLREEARFHNGRAVTAEDFKFSLERACDPRTQSPVASVYLGDIVGALEMLSGRASEISGIEVVDQATLRIRIDEPKAYFLAKLTYSTGFVLDRDNVTNADWFVQANGTGPFRLAQYDSDRIVLERNEDYYRQQPYLKQVVFMLGGGSPMSMYENGELDVVGVGAADIERVLDPANVLHSELSTAPQLDVFYLALDVNQPPFDDAKVRQAFSLAIDRSKITAATLQGMAVAAQGIIPPGMPGYQRERALLGYEPQLAAKLLSDSKYEAAGNLPPITLTIYGSDGELPSHIRAIVAMIRENLGVEVNVEETEDVFAGQPQAYSSGWSADYPDPEDFLDILFHSRSGLNRMGYSNPEVDGLLEKARLATDQTQRMGLYEQAEELIVADAPWIPLWHSVDYVLIKPYVKGAVFSAAIYPWLSDVYLEQS